MVKSSPDVILFKVSIKPYFFDLAGHIRKVDGWFGLYRGLGPRYVQYLYCSVWINFAFVLFGLKQEA